MDRPERVATLIADPQNPILTPEIANKAREASTLLNEELQAIEGTLAKLNEDVGALQAKIKDAKARQNAKGTTLPDTE